MTKIVDSESDLVKACHKSAIAMGAYLMQSSQRSAKGSGTTIGYPDLTLVCAGKVRLIEVKRPKTADHPKGYVTMGQQAVIEKCAEQSVVVHVIDSIGQFENLVNGCRRT